MSRYLSRCLLLFGALALVLRGAPARARVTAEPATAALTYLVSVDEDLEVLSVRTCFRDAPPRALIPGIRAAAPAILDAHDGRGRPLRIQDGGRVDLGRVVAGGCVRYRVDLDRALSAARFSIHTGDDILTSLGAWLWRPSPRLPEGGASLRFDLPPGVEAITPFPRGEDGALVLDPTAFTLPAFMAFAHRRPIVVERHQGRVELVPLGSGWTLDDADLTRWMSLAMDGVSTVQGRFPVDHAVVFLVPTPGRGMEFGMVRRGGGASVGFVVGRESDADDVIQSWVGWHELSHLQLPALEQRDAWLYEGLATYYQEVIPARMGVITDRAAWRSLLNGFERGARSAAQDPLSSASESMMATGAFLRVYWSGTVFALEADVRLRAAGTSLDRQIARAGDRFRAETRLFTGDEVARLLDGGVEGDPVTALRARYVDQVGFPPTAPLLTDLGVRRGDDGVELDDGEHAAIRQAIFTGP